MSVENTRSYAHMVLDYANLTEGHTDLILVHVQKVAAATLVTNHYVLPLSTEARSPITAMTSATRMAS